MGISVHWRTPDLDPFITPREKFDALIEQAISIAIPILERHGIPYRKETIDTMNEVGDPMRYRRHAQALHLAGDAAGCEEIMYGWHRADGKRTNHNFCKTAYAADFLKTHAVVTEILTAWETQGLALDAYDEAGYLRHQDLEQLRNAYAQDQAMRGAVADLLQNIGQKFDMPTPGGGVYRWSPEDETS